MIEPIDPDRQAEEVSHRYPYPLAATYHRAYYEASELDESHEYLLDLFELTLKYSASIALSQYFTDQVNDPRVTPTLLNLQRPSLGHWVGWLRDILDGYRRDRRPLRVPEMATFFAQKNTTEILRASATLRQIMADRLGGSEAANRNVGSITPLQFFQLLVEYRNKLAHGVRPSRHDREQVAGILLPAMRELFAGLSFLADYRLVYVSEVNVQFERGQRGQADAFVYAHHLTYLTGDRPRVAQRPQLLRERPARDKQLYLLDKSSDFQPLLSLHPLLILRHCESCNREQVFVLNLSTDTAADYLSYPCTHHFRPTEYLDDMASILKGLGVEGPPPPTTSPAGGDGASASAAATSRSAAGEAALAEETPDDQPSPDASSDEGSRTEASRTSTLVPTDELDETKKEDRPGSNENRADPKREDAKKDEAKKDDARKRDSVAGPGEKYPLLERLSRTPRTLAASVVGGVGVLLVALLVVSRLVGPGPTPGPTPPAMPSPASPSPAATGSAAAPARTSPASTAATSGAGARATPAVTAAPTPGSAPTPQAQPSATPAPAQPTSPAVPTAILPPAPTFGPRTGDFLFYRDYFYDVNSGWPKSITNPGQYAMGYANGEYRIEAMQKAAYAYGTQSPRGDFATEVQAHLEAPSADGAYALMFRLQDGDNNYQFIVQPGHRAYSLVKEVNGQYTDLVKPTTSPHVNQGVTANYLRVDASGSQLALFVNGWYLQTVSDSTFETGKVGLETLAYSQPVTARFAKLVITKPGILYYDDFLDTTSGFPTSSTSSQYVSQGYARGAYEMALLTATGSTSSSYDAFAMLDQLYRVFDDFTLDVDAQMDTATRSGSYGLVFRAQDPANYYLFAVDPNTGGYQLAKVVDRTVDVLIPWTPSSAIRPGVGLNHLRVVAQGDSLALSINGVALKSIQDSTYKEGKVGFRIDDWLDPISARFANLVVSEPP